MKTFFLILATVLGLAPNLSAKGNVPVVHRRSPSFERRCGWFDHPTPGNLELTDKDGQWIIATQGSHQAEDNLFKLPQFPEGKANWVKTNGDYGYGCACLRVKVDRSTSRILEIRDGQALPLAKCQADKNLRSRSH